jgi:hypothetical protein
MWLDGADTGTITLVGNEVGERRDKSNNNNHASAENGVYRPTYIATGYNGKGTVRFP